MIFLFLIFYIKKHLILEICSSFKMSVHKISLCADIILGRCCMKRILVIFLFFGTFFLGCKNETIVKEITEDKTYLEINNQTMFNVNIYFNTPSSDSLWLKVPVGEKIKKEISPSHHKSGDTVYIEYEYVLIDDIVFPYYNSTSLDCNKELRIYENKVNTINLSNAKIDIKEAFLVLQNKNGNPARLFDKTGEPIEPYKTKTHDAWIQNNSNVVFQVTDTNIEDYCIGSQMNSVQFETEINLKKGYLYHFTYTDEKIVLTSISHLDGTKHTFDYQTDNDSHWGSCIACELERKKEEHMFSQLKMDDTCHWYSCICKMEINKEEHSFTNHAYDNNVHLQKCECGKENKHTLTNWQKLNDKDVKLCTECEFEITADVNTYVIYSVSDLQNISNNDSPAAIFELGNNIDGEGQNWIPIDTFKGTLVGNGYSIKNFKMNKSSGLDNNTAYCGFFYKNQGIIKDIFFKDIEVDAYFEYQTDEWRYVNVGMVVAANYGEINNVHVENIIVKSNLNHTKDKTNDDVQQINIAGGIVGKNYGIITFCSIRQSSISASTDSKNNWCDTSAWAGGICGENTKDCTDLLSIATNVSANTRGGYNWWMGNDGHLKSYAGSVFGIIKGSGNNSKIVSYNNPMPVTSAVYDNKCDNAEEVQKKGTFMVIMNIR